MKIGEVAKETGLSLSNIRFYEKKGLLEPTRDQESNYRDYSREDIERLKLIVLYRKMDISVENIEALLCEKITLHEVLENQMEQLKEQQQILQGSIDLCEEMLHRQEDANLDVDYYLNYIKEEEIKGRKFVDIDDVLSDYTDILTANKSFSFANLDMIFPYRIGKTLKIIFSLFFLLVPIIMLVAAYMEDGGLSSGMIAGIIVIMILCWGPFIRVLLIHKNRK